MNCSIKTNLFDNRRMLLMQHNIFSWSIKTGVLRKSCNILFILTYSSGIWLILKNCTRNICWDLLTTSEVDSLQWAAGKHVVTPKALFSFLHCLDVGEHITTTIMMPAGWWAQHCVDKVTKLNYTRPKLNPDKSWRLTSLYRLGNCSYPKQTTMELSRHALTEDLKQLWSRSRLQTACI